MNTRESSTSLQSKSLQLAHRMRALEPSATLAMAARASAMAAAGVNVVDLSVGEPDFPTPLHICQAAEAHPTIRVRTRRIILARPFVPLPGQEKLVGALQAHAERVLGESIAPQGSPLYTDARHYSAAGIPTVLYGAGPRSMLEANAHRADERILLEDVHRATEIVAGALRDLLAVA
jgi:acetylornithine deacetylase/succinyl-diaminopimelate desuccinylase-like protein